MADKPYPDLICAPCGEKWGHGIPKAHFPTWHVGVCDICGNKSVPVTEPRDYRHLRAGWHEAVVKA